MRLFARDNAMVVIVQGANTARILQLCRHRRSMAVRSAVGYVSASLYLLVPKPGRSLLYVHVSARRLKVRYAECRCERAPRVEQALTCSAAPRPATLKCRTLTRWK